MNRFAQAIQESRVDVVPKIVIGGAGPSSPEAERIRSEMRARFTERPEKRGPQLTSFAERIRAVLKTR